MKFKVRENKHTEFIAGLIMLLLGVIIFTRNLYVATPFYDGTISIGGVYLRTGVFVLPLVGGLVWMFLSPGKKLPRIVSIAGFVLIVGVAIFSVSIRVRYISITKWVLILVLIFGGLLLILRAVHLSRKKY